MGRAQVAHEPAHLRIRAAPVAEGLQLVEQVARGLAREMRVVLAAFAALALSMKSLTASYWERVSTRGNLFGSGITISWWHLSVPQKVA